MILAFYKVDNTLGYAPRDFFRLRTETIKEKISKLDEYELQMFNTAYPYDMILLQDIYNDEQLGRGWFLQVINLNEEKT